MERLGQVIPQKGSLEVEEGYGQGEHESGIRKGVGKGLEAEEG